MREGAGEPVITAMLEVLHEAFPAAVLVYDRNDQLVYAGGQLQHLLPLPDELTVVGTRIRDILCAIFDNLERPDQFRGRTQQMVSREKWLAERTAFLWKERAEYLEERRGGRWLRYLQRRLASGYGVCIIRDVTEKRKREDLQRIEAERCEITGQVLDEMPFPVCVKAENLVYVGVNRAFCQIIQRSREDILGNAPLDLFEDAVAVRLNAGDRTVLETGIATTSHELLVGTDGHEKKVVVRRFRIGNPGSYHVVAALEDITAQAVDGFDFVTLSVAGRPLFAAEGLSLHDIGGKKILVVTSDENTASSAMKSLQNLHAEVSTVTNAKELELFVKIAGDAGIEIDLVLIDDEMAQSCAELLKEHGLPVILIGRGRTQKEKGNTAVDAVFSRAEAHATGDENLLADDLIDVLVAEDNAVNQIVFSQILDGFGYRYAIAANGADAVRIWRERTPRLVLMDVTLPEMNGFEACQRIRELEKGSAPTPVIGVLPHPFEQDRERCFAAGMDDVILKPLSPEMLEAVFLKHMRERITAFA